MRPRTNSRTGSDDLEEGEITNLVLPQKRSFVRPPGNDARPSASGTGAATEKRIRVDAATPPQHRRPSPAAAPLDATPLGDTGALTPNYPHRGDCTPTMPKGECSPSAAAATTTTTTTTDDGGVGSSSFADEGEDEAAAAAGASSHDEGGDTPPASAFVKKKEAAARGTGRSASKIDAKVAELVRTRVVATRAVLDSKRLRHSVSAVTSTTTTTTGEVLRPTVARSTSNPSLGQSIIHSSTVIPSSSPVIPNRTQTPTLASSRAAGIWRSRTVDSFQRLHNISEGTYGVVYMAQDKVTQEVVALKKIKMDQEKEGFPMTALREIRIQTLYKHPYIVDVKEIVVGTNNSCVYIVMEYLDHNLRSLMDSMKQPFLSAETKTLLRQLLTAVDHLHSNWVVHRDIKSTNLLYDNKGHMKLADFGMAREYGSPLKPMTQTVVTLWYRAPEVLLGSDIYSTAVDMWSVGCIFGEFLTNAILLRGTSEVDQMYQMYKLLGPPTEKIWPGWSSLPNAKRMAPQPSHLRAHQQEISPLRKKVQFMTDACHDLLTRLLAYDPAKRLSAAEALRHRYFTEDPLPMDPARMPTWPCSHDFAKKMRPVDESTESILLGGPDTVIPLLSGH
ncbi:CMGC/CDK protein kinase [Pelomyxa schiedti]|nr:CMGC/CDK protein kinase [Pelomyxa schiedti]